MKQFKEYERVAGVPAEYPKRTTHKYKHVFYKNGGVIGESLAGDDATYNALYEKTKIHERIDLRDEDHELAVAQYNAAKSYAHELWMTALREEYPELTPPVFLRIYTLAGENDYYDYDVIADKFDNIARIVIFALETAQT